MSQTRWLAFGSMILTSGLVLAGCSLPFSSKPATQTGSQGKVDQIANSLKLSAMMATGQAGSCTIANTADSAAAKTEIIVKGKKFLMKGSDFGNDSQEETNVSPTVKKTGFMLNDGEFLYFWQDQAATGMKLKIQPSPSPAKTGDQVNPVYTQTTNQDPAKEFESDPKYRVDCVLGGVDDNQLTPPANVKFDELTQTMEFSGANKTNPPQISLPAGEKMPNFKDSLELPIELPIDSNDSGQ